MTRIASPRALIASSMMVAIAVIVGVSGAPVMVAVLAGVVGLAAILIVATDSDPAPSESPAPAPVAGNDLQPLIEAIAEPVLIVADGRVAQANQIARALLGTHIVGEDARIAIRHPAAAERLASPVPPDPGEMIDLVGVGARESRWEMRISPLPGNRRVVHLIDRTGSHAAEKMRVDFVANASHELRTPLAAILGFVETLGDDKAGGDPATRKRFLKVMHDEAHRMQRLVDDLMSLSRIEAEKYLLPDASVDLAQLIGEVHGVIGANGGDRGRDVGVALADDVPFIAGDRAQLSQLLHNLIGNAMKYGRHGTPVTVRLDRGTGSMVRLTVSDQGDGIAAEHLPRLTERFYRVDASRSRALGGTGLGLAIVKHIVERHRGRLDIASVPGKGTTVTILLPPAPIPLSSKSHPVVTEDH
jgi:two-component system phosphate regulon sensor histidine kinase PhoR